MRKIRIFHSWVFSCLLLTSCGTYHQKISYLPNKDDDSWTDGIFRCKAGKIRTTGIEHEPKKFESIFGVPVPYNYSRSEPTVWLAFSKGLMKKHECNIGLVTLAGNGEQRLAPISVYSNLTASYSGYSAFCFFGFSGSKLTKSSYIIEFNNQLSNCTIPDIMVSRSESSGYRFEQIQ